MKVERDGDRVKFQVEDVLTTCEVEARDGSVRIAFGLGDSQLSAVVAAAEAKRIGEALTRAAREATTPGPPNTL